MDGRSVAAVALRIWGVILLLQALATAPGAVLTTRAAAALPAGQESFIHASQVAFLFQLAAGVILGLCLLLWADSLARVTIPQTESLRVGADASQLLAMALVIVGLFTLIRGLEGLAGLGYMLSQKPRWDETDKLSYLWDRQSETMVRAVVDVLAGAVLVFGRRGLARSWAQVRSVVRTGHGLGSH